MREDKIKNQLATKFGNRLRVRVNGILIQEDKLLMIKHQLGDNQEFWSVPGGGMDFGSDARENLMREFKEETSLSVEICDFLFVHEFLDPPLHGIELFFDVKNPQGHPKLGQDPEMEDFGQILQELRWLRADEIIKIPKKSLHQVFWKIKSLEEIRKWTGYFKFGNKSLK